jgi:hypothetical protein
MVYVPENHEGGKYEQPADPGLLIANHVQDRFGNVRMNGGIVESMLNTHVSIWTQYEMTVPDYLPVRLPEMMEMPRFFRLKSLGILAAQGGGRRA